MHEMEVSPLITQSYQIRQQLFLLHIPCSHQRLIAYGLQIQKLTFKVKASACSFHLCSIITPTNTPIYTARFSFCTNEPSSLFLLLLRCFWTNTTKTISISTATAITEHTITSVTIHHPSPSLPPMALESQRSPKRKVVTQFLDYLDK